MLHSPRVGMKGPRGAAIQIAGKRLLKVWRTTFREAWGAESVICFVIEKVEINCW